MDTLCTLRIGQTGGGVCLYVNCHYSVKELNDLIVDDSCSDSLFLEIKTASGKSVIVGVIYRPPDCTYKMFRDHFDNLLLCLNQMNKSCIIMG